ncbi:MAG: DUF1080 domain-containing protein [Chloroflexi bacterium]|nr:DUF1080 domain-containing protein [Chloroflexota bacterium]MBU1750113.1 DUF1080 domain-containing protein [Chloroflexota bacterium]
MTQRCPSCGTEIADEGVFCVGCGARLDDVTGPLPSAESPTLIATPADAPTLMAVPTDVLADAPTLMAVPSDALADAPTLVAMPTDAPTLITTPVDSPTLVTVPGDTLPPAPPSPPSAPPAGDNKTILGCGIAALVAGVLLVCACVCLALGGVVWFTVQDEGGTAGRSPTRTRVVVITERPVTVRPKATARPVDTARPEATARKSPTRVVEATERVITTTPVPEATARPSTGSAAFADDFSTDRGDWNVADSTNGKRWIADGEFYIQITQANYVVWSLLRDREYQDVEVKVDAHAVSGTGGNYGLVFRAEDTSNFYRFEVSDAGKYKLAKLVSRSWKTVKDWTSASAISKGTATNTLKVEVRGSSITLYANDTKLVTITDSDFGKGSVGLVVGAGSTGDFTAAFDNLEVAPQ